MKRRFYICLSIFLLLYFNLSTNSYAMNTTVSVDVAEIVVSCADKGGGYEINGKQYNEKRSFFRRKGDSIVIKAVPKYGFKLKGVTCDTDALIIVGTNCVSIENIDSNAKIEFDFVSTMTSKPKEELETQVCDGGESCPIKHFIDVDTNSWYHLDVDYAVENGFMNGITNEIFEPHSPTTRAMIVTILYRLEGKPNVKYTDIFDDVEREAWYTDAIIWANENGIVLGYGDGNFGPSDMVTREQMVTILYRYAKYKNYKIEKENDEIFLNFNDAEVVSDWAKESMKWACGVEIIKGMENNLIMPRNSTERCQIAAILHRFCENIVNKK